MTQNNIVQAVSTDAVRLTTNTVEKRFDLAKQEIYNQVGLRVGVVQEYDVTARTGLVLLDNQALTFKAIDTTVAVGDRGVFLRLTNGERVLVLMGVVL
jgi:hypothetical protein